MVVDFPRFYTDQCSTPTVSLKFLKNTWRWPLNKGNVYFIEWLDRFGNVSGKRPMQREQGKSRYLLMETHF